MRQLHGCRVNNSRRQHCIGKLGTGLLLTGDLLFINDLLKVPNAHWRSSQIIYLQFVHSLGDPVTNACQNASQATGAFYLGPIFFVSLFLRLQAFLICHKLLFHQQPIFYTLELEQPQLAFGIWCDIWKLGAKTRSSTPLLLFFANSWWWHWWLPLFFLFISLQATAGVKGAHTTEAVV